VYVCAALVVVQRMCDEVYDMDASRVLVNAMHAHARTFTREMHARKPAWRSSFVSCIEPALKCKQNRADIAVHLWYNSLPHPLLAQFAAGMSEVARRGGEGQVYSRGRFFSHSLSLSLPLCRPRHLHLLLVVGCCLRCFTDF
jgi:hypothetical protein